MLESILGYPYSGIRAIAFWVPCWGTSILGNCEVKVKGFLIDGLVLAIAMIVIVPSSD